MFAVTFRIYSLYNHGKNKGKPNPESFHTLTLYRDPDNNESVGDTLKRAKGMVQEGTRVTILNPGMETDDERLKRYAREGKEVVVPKDAVEAGDSTMVKTTFNPALIEAANEALALQAPITITITPSEAPAMADAVAV